MAAFVSSVPLSPVGGSISLFPSQCVRTFHCRPLSLRHRAAFLSSSPVSSASSLPQPRSSAASNGTSSHTPTFQPIPSSTPFRDFLSGLRHLARPLWNGDRRLIAYLWTAAAVLLAFMASAYAVMLSMVQRFFWNCLAAKDVSKFGKLLTLYIVVVTLGPIVISLFSWIKGRLALMWRAALTNHLLSGYFSSLNYYKLTLGTSVIDNPDQRIAEDVNRFTERAVRFITIMGVAAFDLIIFSIILHGIYPPLLYTLFVYSAIGTSLIAYTGRDLLRLNRQQVSREADFRFGLVRVRETTESIAFYGGEAAEQSELKYRFLNAFRNSILLLGLSRNVEFLSTGFRYFAQVVPMAVIAPRYFAGSVKLGVMSQVFFSFNHVLSSLGLVVQEFAALSQFGAGVRRLKALSDEISASKDDFGENVGRIETRIEDSENGGRIILENVSVMTPSNPPRTLAEGVNVEVRDGERLLVIGQSGVGKSSLMRVVCGLWNWGEGLVERPSKKHTLFLPQRPFIMLGSLRENVVYPCEAGTVSDEQVLDALERVNLGYLVEAVGGLEAGGEGLSRRLSLGEQQRLGFARVVISRPRVVVLDESSSALDGPNEARMYEIVKELGVTCVSVGNRPSLLDFHDRALQLLEGGKWRLLTVEEAKDVQSESLSV